jgi:hypothetical protein
MFTKPLGHIKFERYHNSLGLKTLEEIEQISH